jgi:hypothetical protein
MTMPAIRAAVNQIVQRLHAQREGADRNTDEPAT